MTGQPPEREQDEAARCWVCGPDNLQGLRIPLLVDGDVVRSTFTPQPHHQGYDGVTHGGIIGAVLDDVMANCFYLRGETAYTVKMEVRFRQPCPTGRPFFVEARVVGRKGRFATAKATALLEDETVVAEAMGTFSVRPRQGRL